VGSWSFLIFGIVIGMQHALEADHLAAVGALSAGKTGRRRLVLLGTSWGLGHTIALFALSLGVLLLGFVLTKQMQAALEVAVGVIVVLLGANVVWNVARRRVHLHVHHHGDGRRHIHAHAHAHAEEPTSSAHDVHRHSHHERRLLAALGVGLVHGAAGSGVLLALTAATADSVAGALLYVAFFGVGSITGMAALSFAASYPLRVLERAADWLNMSAMFAIGSFAIIIGANLVLENWTLLIF
jgi:ABC-type nickel/cobalt efflux system permease component RcnA